MMFEIDHDAESEPESDQTARDELARVLMMQ